MKKVALISGLVGAVMLAANLNLTIVAYCLMMLGSIIWIITLWRTEREAALLNLGFALINIIGIVRAI
jgi:hypothetical protein